jgi:hypothetical protein
MKAPSRGINSGVSVLDVQWEALTGFETGSADIDSYNL